ncbi:MAG: FMN-dependent NADH-azoreductase [Methylococcaceae bacterium TMED69]|nr:MAG: FMN-dependent NADH-azoreductase [Methylococcaceae bacterium TMED69]
MKRVLYIESSPRKARSHSIEVAREFLKEYERLNPEDVIDTLDLWSMTLPPFSGEVIDTKYRIMHGEKVSQGKKSEWNKIVELFDQFNSADKYVFSVPMWNFGIPYRLKHYIDLITQPSLAWSFTPDEGYRGLVVGKVVILYSSGGDYTEANGLGELDHQKKPFENWLGFIGLGDFKIINVSPTLGAPEAVKQIVECAKTNAIDTAQHF